jgi:hypothetical protein
LGGIFVVFFFFFVLLLLEDVAVVVELVRKARAGKGVPQARAQRDKPVRKGFTETKSRANAQPQPAALPYVKFGNRRAVGGGEI